MPARGTDANTPSIQANADETVLDAMRRAGESLYAPCAGRGICGKCRIIARGELTAPADAERDHLSPDELAAGVRLACQARIAGDVTIQAAGPGPSDAWRDEPEPDPVTALRALLAIAGYDPDAHRDLDTRDAVVEFLRRGDSALGALPTRVLDGVVRTVTGTNRLIRGHHHRRHIHRDHRRRHILHGRRHRHRLVRVGELH